MKSARTEVDNWFMELVGGMGINSDDLTYSEFNENMSVIDFDEIHRADRKKKGIGTGESMLRSLIKKGIIRGK
jgi:hypothetical protein